MTRRFRGDAGLLAGAAVVAAVDLGASGGRVIAGQVSRDGVELHEVSRFRTSRSAPAGRCTGTSCDCTRT